MLAAGVIFKMFTKSNRGHDVLHTRFCISYESTHFKTPSEHKTDTENICSCTTYNFMIWSILACRVRVPPSLENLTPISTGLWCTQNSLTTNLKAQSTLTMLKFI